MSPVPGGVLLKRKTLPVLRQRLGGHRACLGSSPNRFDQTSSGQRGASRGTLGAITETRLAWDTRSSPTGAS